MSDFEYFVQKNCKPLTEKEKLQRFFNYILDFKLGEQKSYRNYETNSSKLKEHNNFTREDDESLSEESVPNIILSSESLALSSSLRRTQEKQSIKKENLGESINLIHYGYGCDKCYTNPIVGERYNCKLCDYDLCESCYMDNLQERETSAHPINSSSAFPCSDIHEHPLVNIKAKSRNSKNAKELLLSGRKEKSFLNNSHSQLLRSEKLRRSTK